MALELSVKSGKDSTTTLSLVINRVRFWKNLSIQENHQIWGFSEFHPLSFSFFPERLHWCYIYFHCSYLYNYYNSSGNFCIKCWVLSISYRVLIKFPYFTDSIKRGVRGWKTGWIYWFLYWLILIWWSRMNSTFMLTK